MRKLAGALLLFVWAASACTRGQAMPSVAADVVADGWKGVRLQTLCLEVQQSYPEIDPAFSLPLEAALHRLLPRLGIRVAASGEPCDGTLRLTLQGQALAANYQCILGSACGHCFTGARVTGDLTLTSSARPPFVRSLQDESAPPGSISECPKLAKDAPLDNVWPWAVLYGLGEVWGTPVLAAAIGDQDASVRKGAVRLLGTLGKEGAPLLVQALRDKDSNVRWRAAQALQSHGAPASEAVPALVGALGDSTRLVSQSAASALQAITGQNLGQDQGAWRKWMKESNVTPTPVPSYKGVPIKRDALLCHEVGTVSYFYAVQGGCGNMVAFYQAQMPSAAWALDKSTSLATGRQVLYFKKGGATADIHLTDVQLMGQSRCSIQIWVN